MFTILLLLLFASLVVLADASDQNGVEGSMSLRRVVTSSKLQIPFHVNALDFTNSYEIDNDTFGDCRAEGGVDAQKSSDPICLATGPCNIGWTAPGEWVSYEFYTDSNDIIELPDGTKTILVDITIRVASHSDLNTLELEILDGNEFGPVAFYNSPGKGFQEFQDIVWRSVGLFPEDNKHELQVKFSDGSVNLCSIKIQKSNIPPVTLSALDYSSFYDSDEVHQGDCGVGPVDAQTTTDNICRDRDQSKCNIGWTQSGEWLTYDFYVGYGQNETYDIWLRIASLQQNRKISLELSPPVRREILTKEFIAPGNGFQEFEDFVWEGLPLEGGDYTIKIEFKTGGVNLCSLRIMESQQTGSSFVSVPSTTNALEYADYVELTQERLGDCGDGGPVDAQLTRDPSGVCQETGECNIAFTNPGESVKYQFETDGRNATIDLSLRVASLRADKTFRVQILAGEKLERTFHAPGLGWQNYQDEVWDNIYIGSDRYYEMHVHFTTGQVNFCSFSISYAQT